MYSSLSTKVNQANHNVCIFKLKFNIYSSVSTRNFRRRLQPLPSVKTLHLDLELKPIRMDFVDHIFPNVLCIAFYGKVFRCECLFYNPLLCRRCSDAILHKLLLFKSLTWVFNDTRLLIDCQQKQEDIQFDVLDPLFRINGPIDQRN